MNSRRRGWGAEERERWRGGGGVEVERTYLEAQSKVNRENFMC
jgi:hypothetical protein